MGDVRMIELGQYLALQLEPRVHSARHGSAVHHLDGDLLFELGIGSLGEIYLAHAAGTQGAQYPVRSYAISHHFRSMRSVAGLLQTNGPCGRVLLACMKAGPPSVQP